MLIGSKRKRRLLIAGCAALIGSLLLYAYFTGDQQNSVAWSGNFTIDTQDPISVTRALSTAAEEASGLFTIDTRDPDSVARPASHTITFSAFFSIDTTDPDSVSRANSLAVEETSGFFTIDTRADGSTYTLSAFFTIDTRDADSVWRGISLTAASTSWFFTIDTQDPPPEDSDNDKLHDLWEQIYFGSDLLLTNPEDNNDGDSWDNFAEFAFGLDPRKPDGSPIRDSWIETSGGQTWFYFQFTRHILAIRMVDYYVEVSGGLDGWQDVTNDVEEVPPVENLTGAVEVVTMRYPLPEPLSDHAFIRIRAEPKN